MCPSMRLALIGTEKLPIPPIKGGAIQTYIDQVTRFLTQHHDVTVLGIGDPALPPVAERHGATYLRISTPPNEETLYLKGLVNEIARMEFDLIHIFNRPAFVLPIKAVSPRSRMVTSIHNEMFRPNKIAPGEARKCIATVEKIITISHYIGRTVLQLYPEAEAKLRTIHAGANVADFLPRWMPGGEKMNAEVRKELGLGPGPVVLFVGRLSQTKGAHLVLHAIMEVFAKHPEAQLLIVGSKWYGGNEEDYYTGYLRELARPFKNRIFFTGFVPPAEVPRYFATGDVFVCASQWNEPLARVHYEAMAAGLPIVTTDSGGNAEVVHGLGNGWVIKDWHNPKAFARAISAYLGDKKLAEKTGKRGRELAVSNYTWKRVASELMEVYEG